MSRRSRQEHRPRARRPPPDPRPRLPLPPAPPRPARHARPGLRRLAHPALLPSSRAAVRG